MPCNVNHSDKLLADNPTAESVLGDVTLKQIAHELVDSVRKNTSIDWQLKESVQAKLRVMIKRISRKYKYPPDEPSTGEYTVSVTKVLDQAEMLADFWTKDNYSSVVFCRSCIAEVPFWVQKRAKNGTFGSKTRRFALIAGYSNLKYNYRDN